MSIPAVSVKRLISLGILIVTLSGLLLVRDEIETHVPIPAEALTLLTLVLCVMALVSSARILIISSYRRRLKLTPGEQDNFVLGVDAAANVIVVAVGLAALFPALGVPFREFLTSLSLFSVALAWLFKEHLSNFFDSFRLMFSTDFLIGDYIKINDTTKGYIADITFRATRVKTDEGDVLYIPNSTMMNNEITNYSKVRLKRITVPFTLPTHLARDIPMLEHHLTEVVKEAAPDSADTVKVFLRVTGVTGDQTKLQLETSIDRFSFAIETKIHRAVYEAVLRWGHA
ncbi:mechanosensitive ion channel [Patescibacteria group bacterium]|jgi:small-conductance mechanosensitive channel|nr:mechanosensitive ion channel [Patescibacteria group bacterium]